MWREAGVLKDGWTRDRIVEAISEICLEKAFRQAGLGPAARLPVVWELRSGQTQAMACPTKQ